jgi:hypothetical protein
MFSGIRQVVELLYVGEGDLNPKIPFGCSRQSGEGRSVGAHSHLKSSVTGEPGVPAAVTDTVTPALPSGFGRGPPIPDRIRPAAQRRGCSPATYASHVGLAKSYAEEAASRGYWSLDKTVCPAHIDDVLLRQLIEEYATETACSYCGNVNTDESPIAATGPCPRVLDTLNPGMFLGEAR